MNSVNTNKAYKGLPMEGLIAKWYAKTTLKDIHRHQLMAEQVYRKISPGGSVLEIAPGPGYFCIELAKLGNFKITGLDISRSFVEMARKNAAKAGVQAEFRQGDAANLPFEDNTFDFIFCQAAFKNFTHPVKAIAEMYRCLRPGGTATIVDMRREATHADIETELRKMGLGPIDEALTRWTFQNMLLKSAYSTAEIESFVAQTPFGKCKLEVGGIGFQVWLKK